MYSSFITLRPGGYTQFSILFVKPVIAGFLQFVYAKSGEKCIPKNIKHDKGEDLNHLALRLYTGYCSVYLQFKKIM